MIIILILGDFNATIHEEAMHDFCEMYDLENLIKEPTCYKNAENLIKEPTCYKNAENLIKEPTCYKNAENLIKEPTCYKNAENLIKEPTCYKNAENLIKEPTCYKNAENLIKEPTCYKNAENLIKEPTCYKNAENLIKEPTCYKNAENLIKEPTCYKNAENLIKEPTCYKNAENPSSIDVILTNSKMSFRNSIAIETGLSDHHKMAVTVLKIYTKKMKPITVNFRSYKNFDIWEFRKYLKQNLENFDKETLTYDDFKLIFMEILDFYAPMKNKVVRRLL